MSQEIHFGVTLPQIKRSWMEASEAAIDFAQLGFDSVWTAEAYGSDATSPLAFLAAVTERVRLGTCIMQLAGRTPAMAAMQAATIDALAGGARIKF